MPITRQGYGSIALPTRTTPRPTVASALQTPRPHSVTSAGPTTGIERLGRPNPSALPAAVDAVVDEI